MLHADEKGLLVATVDDGWPKKCGIVKLSPAGEILWFYQTENSVKNDFTLDYGVLYTQDYMGMVYALDTALSR